MTAQPDPSHFGARLEGLRGAARGLMDELARRLVAQGIASTEIDAHLQAARGETPAHFSALPAPFVASLARWSQARPATLRDVNRYVWAAQVAAFDGTTLPLTTPESVQRLYERELDRVLAQLRADDDRYADARHDSQRKDLAILGGRLVPVGAGFAAPRAGVPRSVLLKGGVGQFARGLVALVRGGGARPWLELHTHLDCLSDFSAAGWEQSYLRLAELLALNPHLRGVFRASWFLDPALQQISPNLAYLRELPLRHGACLLFVQRDLVGDSGALHRSARRRQLFDEGRYVPDIYLMAWPRRDLLRWAESHA